MFTFIADKGPVEGDLWKESMDLKSRIKQLQRPQTYNHLDVCSILHRRISLTHTPPLPCPSREGKQEYMSNLLLDLYLDSVGCALE
jgi:hypothetical protein